EGGGGVGVGDGKVTGEGSAADVTAIYRRRSGQEAGDDAGAMSEDMERPDWADDDSSRWGTGAIRFRDVALEGGSGERGRHFETGSPLRLHLELEARDAVDDLVVGLALRRSDGLHVSGTNTPVEP